MMNFVWNYSGNFGKQINMISLKEYVDYTKNLQQFQVNIF